MIKTILLAAAVLFAWSTLAFAQVWVSPHVRKDGTYVPGHYRTKPDNNPYNNWSYPGNVNPYTGERATGDSNRYLERYRNSNDTWNPYKPNLYNDHR